MAGHIVMKGNGGMHAGDGMECAAPSGDICGEGAVWHPQRSALYWVDINRFLLHELVAELKTTRTWFFEEPVTSVNLTEDPEKLLLVFASRIGFWSPQTHPQIEAIYHLDAAPGMRFNDAGVDPVGALWVGTMANNVGPSGEEISADFKDGALYRIDPNCHATLWKQDIGISNTIAWSPDQSKFYFGDSAANRLYVYAYDDQKGTIEDEKVLLEGYLLGVPDGSAMDSEGFLWNARPGAGCIIRIGPDGRVDRTVRVPVKRPTTCAFGGPTLETLYVTSARSEERLSGSVFAFRPGIAGIPAGCFRIE